MFCLASSATAPQVRAACATSQYSPDVTSTTTADASRAVSRRDGLDPVHPRHPHVDQDHLGVAARSAASSASGPDAASTTGSNPPIALDQLARDGPEHRLVVDRHHPDGSAAACIAARASSSAKTVRQPRFLLAREVRSHAAADLEVAQRAGDRVDRRIVADHEQRGRPGLTSARIRLTNATSMPTSTRLPATAPAAAPNASPVSGTRKISPSTRPQKPPHSAPGPVRLPASRSVGLRRDAGHVMTAASSTSVRPRRPRPQPRQRLSAPPAGGEHPDGQRVHRRRVAPYTSTRPMRRACDDRLRARAGVELAVDGVRVGLDRVRGHLQPHPHLAEREVGRQHAQHAQLGGRERRTGRRARRPRTRRRAPGSPRSRPPPAARRRLAGSTPRGLVEQAARADHVAEAQRRAGEGDARLDLVPRRPVDERGEQPQRVPAVLLRGLDALAVRAHERRDRVDQRAIG